MTEQEKLIVTKYDLLFEARLAKVEALTDFDSRITKVESSTDTLKEDMKEIRQDMRWIMNIMLTGFGSLLGLMLGMLGIMAHGFKWI